MAESSYYSKGEQMAWDDREIIAQFLCRDEAAIKNTADKYERYCSSIAYRILGNGEDVRECFNNHRFEEIEKNIHDMQEKQSEDRKSVV